MTIAQGEILSYLAANNKNYRTGNFEEIKLNGVYIFTGSIDCYEIDVYLAFVVGIFHFQLWRFNGI